MDKIRWGVLSTAKIGREKVIPATQRSQFGAVTAIASRDLSRAQDRRPRELGIEKAYGSYQELLSDRNVDAIYIPLPNHLHVPWSIRALKAGKHVLCEKPIGLSVAEAEQLAGVAAAHPKLKVMEAFMYRFHPQWQTARQLVQEGRIGQLRTIHTSFSYYNDDPQNIRNQRDIGGGALMDIGCYPISLSRFIFDAEPQRVLGQIERDPATQVDRLTSGVLEFFQGTSTFTCGNAARAVPAGQHLRHGGPDRDRDSVQCAARSAVPHVAANRHAAGAPIEEIRFDVCDQYTLAGRRLRASDSGRHAGAHAAGRRGGQHARDRARARERGEGGVGVADRVRPDWRRRRARAATAWLILTRFACGGTIRVPRSEYAAMSTMTLPVSPPSRTDSATWRIVLGYALMLVVAVALIWLVLSYGSKNLSPTAVEAADGRQRPLAPHQVRCACIMCCSRWCSILLLGRWLGKLFVHFGQPRVIGEMVAGIMLGPSLLGHIWPQATAVYPAGTMSQSSLKIIAQIGVILYMFLVGLELNAGLIRSRAHATVAISHASIVVPFLLGAILALWLYPRFAHSRRAVHELRAVHGRGDVDHGVSRAGPHSHRSQDGERPSWASSRLAARRSTTSRPGACLAFVVGVAQAEVGGAVQTTLLAVGVHRDHARGRAAAGGALSRARRRSPAAADGRVGAGRPVVLGDDGRVDRHPRDLRRVPAGGHHSARQRRGPRLHATSSKTSSRSCCCPRSSPTRACGRRSAWFPAGQAWVFCAVIILVATLGKFGGTLRRRRASPGSIGGLSAALGILMNTRGLMELIVLNIGLELGVISPTLFAMMVIMALVTTIATTPVLHALTSVTAQPEKAAA